MVTENSCSSEICFKTAKPTGETPPHNLRAHRWSPSWHQFVSVPRADTSRVYFQRAGKTKLLVC